MVHQAARRGHHDLAALFQPVDLPLHIGPAVHAGNAHRRHKVGQILQVPGNLLGQLPSGGQNHRLRAGKFLVQAFDHRNAEGTGFARARGGLGDHVPPGHHHRNDLFLNFGHFGKAHALHGLVQLRADVQFTIKHGGCFLSRPRRTGFL